MDNTQRDPKRVYRNYPRLSLEQALAVAQKIQDEAAGKPFKRLLLADALGVKQASSNFRNLLRSSHKYGLTEGSEKAPEIALTELGAEATQASDPQKAAIARQRAAMTPEVFRRFYSTYSDRKLPSGDMMAKVLVADYGVPETNGDECAQLILTNGRFAGVVRDIGGSPHVLLDAGAVTPPRSQPEEEDLAETATDADDTLRPLPATSPKDAPLRPIFIGHGKNKKPLGKIEKLLQQFQIPYRVAEEEPNLARPIPQKVKETMAQCGSAILIFTKDEPFFDADGNEIWRPRENVVHELGAASFLYDNRIVVFKENGLTLPTNFQSIGYIEFDVESIESKTMELLKELIGFGLIKIMPAS
jgi:predicted nucleotide-binding protein